MWQRAGAPLAVGLWLRYVRPFQITPKEIQMGVKEPWKFACKFFIWMRLASKSEDGLSDKIKNKSKIEKENLKLQMKICVVKLTTFSNNEKFTIKIYV